MTLDDLLAGRHQPYENWQVHTPAASQTNAALSHDIALRLRNAIEQKGSAVLSVSGGKSPIALFEHLSKQPIDWSRVWITLVDERCVPCTHPASNALLVRTHLCQHLAAKANFIPMVTLAQAPLPSATALAHTASQALAGVPAADVMVLGMGEDGHTASLFPQAPNLTQALDLQTEALCLPIELANPPENAPYARITQTLRHLLASRHVILPLTGATKLAVLAQALSQAPHLSQSTPSLPIAYVLHQTQTPVALWIST